MDYVDATIIGFITLGVILLLVASVTSLFNSPEAYACDHCSLRWQSMNYTGLAGIALLATGLIIALYL